MNVLIALDKFKHCMDATVASQIVSDEVKRLHPEASVTVAPLTDGGEGFATILTKAAHGVLHEARVHGPRFNAVTSHYGLVPFGDLPVEIREMLEFPSTGTLGVIEMASASGLELIPASERDPWQGSTFGTGELLRITAESGADAILIGLGGSATNDAGLGALEALGMRFLNIHGVALPRITPASFHTIDSVSGSVGASMPPLYLACDVTNPLLGENGATASFGLQKGLRQSDVFFLERAMERMAQLLLAHFEYNNMLLEEEGIGAAGGIGFGLRAAFKNTRIISGWSVVERWINLKRHLEWADLILTGEGRFDSSSLNGKGPGSIIKQAAGKQVVVLAGSIENNLSLPENTITHAISPERISPEQALRDGPTLLQHAVRKCFN